MYLPNLESGELWQNHFTFEKHKGGQWIVAAAPLSPPFNFPLFRRIEAPRGLTLAQTGRCIGVSSAGSSEVQAVPCGLQNSVWDIPWLGLASSWTPGTGPIAAMAPSRKCLEASVKTGQLSLRSCSNSSAEQNFSFVLVKGCQFGDCDYSDAWPKPWEPNSFGIASVTPSSDTNVRCVQAREDSTLWLNSSCVATALMANQLWRVQDAARAKSAA